MTKSFSKYTLNLLQVTFNLYHENMYQVHRTFYQSYLSFITKTCTKYTPDLPQVTIYLYQEYLDEYTSRKSHLAFIKKTCTIFTHAKLTEYIFNLQLVSDKLHHVKLYLVHLITGEIITHNFIGDWHWWQKMHVNLTLKLRPLFIHNETINQCFLRLMLHLIENLHT